MKTASRKRLETAERSETNSREIGFNARILRLKRRITLDELAEKSSLSKGHLSRFERGEKALSVAALLRLASALNTSVSGLIGERVEDDLLHLVRSSELEMRDVSAEDGGYRYAILGRSATSEGIDSFMVDIPGQGERTCEGYHAGEEIFFVLNGRVEVTVADRTVVLQSGDYLQFSGSLHHVTRGLAAQNRVLVIVVDGSGDRAASPTT